MTLLALDLGTHCGYATHHNGLITSGVINLQTDRFSGGGMRYLRFQRWLTEVHASTPVTEVVYEAVHRHRGTDAAHVYGGLMATLTAWCESEGVPYEGVPVQDIKKFATGKGNADKTAVIDAMRKRGHKPKDDNEADALALLLLRVNRNLFE